jgi:hypothetical protein
VFEFDICKKAVEGIKYSLFVGQQYSISNSNILKNKIVDGKLN